MFYVVWVVLAAIPLLQGWDYYQLDLTDRAYSVDHEFFKPSGLWGHSLGIIGSMMMIVGVAMYSIRKRFSALEHLGKLSTWLSVHIFLCTLGPFFVVLHTSFRFSGLVSISFWSMVIVVASGVFGRYVYIRIPKTLNGQFQDAANIRQSQQQLVAEMTDDNVNAASVDVLKNLLVSSGSDGRSIPLMSSIRLSLRSRRDQKLFKTKAEANVKTLGLANDLRERLVGLAVEHWKLEKQLELMKPFQRLFGYWHVFHLPLAIVMFLILFLHVGVAIAFGYTWIF